MVALLPQSARRGVQAAHIPHRITSSNRRGSRVPRPSSNIPIPQKAPRLRPLRSKARPNAARIANEVSSPRKTLPQAANS